MTSAYLYVRVSTDEQKRRGYSLPEQEDRLLRYCEYNGIKVKDIFREDFSAKTFNRPEWKKLVTTIKKERRSGENNILFIKWDRFSRNIQNAYEMIGILKKYNTIPMAIDQPIDLTIPESSVMLAVYLSVPEAENTRRALNTVNGMRRAKQMGRYPNKAPLGFINLTATDGKKFIVPKQPEAKIIKWVFHQLAKNIYKHEEIRKMANVKGLGCSRSNFSKLIRNPVYCGLIILDRNTQECQMVKGIHQQLVSEALFNEVQEIIGVKRKNTRKTEELRTMFFLTGHLVCPICKGRIYGSFSRGSTKRYPYYHCNSKCKTRVNASLINDSYRRKLQQLKLKNEAVELFIHILENWNLGTQRIEYQRERIQILKQLEEQENLLSKARRLFVGNLLEFDDFREMKKEYKAGRQYLTMELDSNTTKLKSMDQQLGLTAKSIPNIFEHYCQLDVADMRHVSNLIPPVMPNFKTGDVSLDLNNALTKILI